MADPNHIIDDLFYKEAHYVSRLEGKDMRVNVTREGLNKLHINDGSNKRSSKLEDIA